MKVAICGYPPLAAQLFDALKISGLEVTHFVNDFISGRGETSFNLPSTTPLQLVNFFEFCRLIESGTLDSLIIAEEGLYPFTKEVIKICKLYEIPTSVINFWNTLEQIYWLDGGKAFIPYMETNLIDSCNLNCRGCTHFANLFTNADFYALEDFKRDIRRIAETADVLRLRLMGGEPLLLKNLDQYIKIARKFLPNTALRLVTNGLMIPNAPQNLLNALRENQFTVDISLYPPTLKILDKIKSTLAENNIPIQDVTGEVKTFNVFLSLSGKHNSEKSRTVCHSDLCRFLRDGKLYKCPVNALSFRLAERFGLKDFPAATGVDIFAKNFPALLEQLDGNVELCSWCNETARQIHWSTENKPALTDWLANPLELKRLQS